MIAQGSCALVCRAYDIQAQEYVAIKRVEKPDNQGIAVTLLREAAVLRTLQHPNIVQLQNVIVTSSSIYLVLELCACNLRHHLQELQAAGQATMDLDQLKRIASHIFSALACCHEHHVMHRSRCNDIKKSFSRCMAYQDFAGRTIKTTGISRGRDNMITLLQTPGEERSKQKGASLEALRRRVY